LTSLRYGVPMSIINSVWDRYRALDQKNNYLTLGLATAFLAYFMTTDLLQDPASGSGYVKEDTLGWFLGFAQLLPLLLFRKAPLAAVVIIFVAFVIHANFDYVVLWVGQVTSLIGVFVVANTTNNRQSAFAGLLGIASIIYVIGGIQGSGDGAVAGSILVGSVWITGNITRLRWNRLVIAELTVTELSDQQERATQQATNEERSRIARELHDIVGHALNLVVIQAGAAQRVFPTSHEKALDAMKSVESNGRQALSDVDRMLGILRTSDDASTAASSRETPPSISHLNSLIEQLKPAGQSTKLVMSGTPVALTPSTDLSAYRVVQEALTNVMTHAAGATAHVEVEYGEESLSVTITNDNSGIDKTAGRTSGGRGIIGMRERTALFGGTFEAGQTDGGGWRVHATFSIGSTGGLK
jgi:signal transduction histidine kinase